MHSFAPDPDQSQLVNDLELEVLRAWCASRTGDSSSQQTPSKSRAMLREELLAYNWRKEEHRVVFDAISRLPGRSAAELCQQLPAQATRMGFPDVQWSDYFNSTRSVVPDALLEDLVRELLATAP
jgi:hypothetical protein